MATLITSSSDPALHARLLGLWDGDTGFVTASGDKTYKVIHATAEPQFLEYDTIPELVDSRSFGELGATYNELEPDYDPDFTVSADSP